MADLVGYFFNESSAVSKVDFTTATSSLGTPLTGLAMTCITSVGWDGTYAYVLAENVSTAQTYIARYNPTANTWNSTQFGTGFLSSTGEGVVSDGVNVYFSHTGQMWALNLLADNIFQMPQAAFNDGAIGGGVGGGYGGWNLVWDRGTNLYVVGCATGGAMVLHKIDLLTGILTPNYPMINAPDLPQGAADFCNGTLCVLGIPTTSGDMYLYVGTDNGTYVSFTKNVTDLACGGTPVSDGHEIVFYSCFTYDATHLYVYLNNVAPTAPAGYILDVVGFGVTSSTAPTQNNGTNGVFASSLQSAFNWYNADGVTPIQMIVPFGTSYFPGQTAGPFEYVVQSNLGGTNVTVAVVESALEPITPYVLVSATEGGTYAPTVNLGTLAPGGQASFWATFTAPPTIAPGPKYFGFHATQGSAPTTTTTSTTTTTTTSTTTTA